MYGRGGKIGGEHFSVYDVTTWKWRSIKMLALRIVQMPLSCSNSMSQTSQRAILEAMSLCLITAMTGMSIFDPFSSGFSLMTQNALLKMI